MMVRLRHGAACGPRRQGGISRAGFARLVGIAPTPSTCVRSCTWVAAPSRTDSPFGAGRLRLGFTVERFRLQTVDGHCKMGARSGEAELVQSFEYLEQLRAYLGQRGAVFHPEFPFRLLCRCPLDAGGAHIPGIIAEMVAKRSAPLSPVAAREFRQTARRRPREARGRQLARRGAPHQPGVAKRPRYGRGRGSFTTVATDRSGAPASRPRRARPRRGGSRSGARGSGAPGGRPGRGGAP